MSPEELAALLSKNPALKVHELLKTRGKKPKPPPIPRPMFDSAAEERYYTTQVMPRLATGIISSCEIHQSFEVVEAVKHNGMAYKNRIYTPDFILKFRDGSTDIVEIKGREIKKLQRDYPLRRQLFIIKYCIPNGWKFIEIAAEDT